MLLVEFKSVIVCHYKMMSYLLRCLLRCSTCSVRAFMASWCFLRRLASADSCWMLISSRSFFNLLVSASYLRFSSLCYIIFEIKIMKYYWKTMSHEQLVIKVIIIYTAAKLSPPWALISSCSDWNWIVISVTSFSACTHEIKLFMIDCCYSLGCLIMTILFIIILHTLSRASRSASSASSNSLIRAWYTNIAWLVKHHAGNWETPHIINQ